MNILKYLSSEEEYKEYSFIDNERISKAIIAVSENNIQITVEVIQDGSMDESIFFLIREKLSEDHILIENTLYFIFTLEEDFVKDFSKLMKQLLKED